MVTPNSYLSIPSSIPFIGGGDSGGGGGKIKGGPSAVDFSSFTPQLVWKPTTDNNTKGLQMNWITEIDLTLAGGPLDAEPWATMNTWY
jgi:hypothetical protein